LAIGDCGKNRFDLEEYQKGVIALQLLIIKHGPISDHQTDYPTAMSEGKKRDI